jgi:hypothetical protein
LTHQNSPKWIDCGWPFSDPFSAPCIFISIGNRRLFLQFLNRIRRENGKKSDEFSNTVSVGTLIEETQLELNDQTGSWRKALVTVVYEELHSRHMPVAIFFLSIQHVDFLQMPIVVCPYCHP